MNRLLTCWPTFDSHRAALVSGSNQHRLLLHVTQFVGRSCQRSANAFRCKSNSCASPRSSVTTTERTLLTVRTHPRFALCIDYPISFHSTTTVASNTTNSPLCPQALAPPKQLWLVLCLQAPTSVTPTATTFTTPTPPSWRGLKATGSATPALSSDLAGSCAEVTSSSRLNWAISGRE